MEEIEKQLDQLNDLTLKLSYISGLVCILKDALQYIDLVDKPQYASACYFLNDFLAETLSAFQQLTEDLYSAFYKP